MASVSFSKYTDYIQKPLTEVSDAIRRSKSVLLRSLHVNDSAALIDFLFTNYKARSRYFGRQKDDYLYLTLAFDATADIESIDSRLLQVFSQETGHYLETVSALDSYLNRYDQTLVIALSGEAGHLLRYILSYKFIFGEHVVFVYMTERENLYFDTTVDFTVSGDFLHTVARDRIHELGLDFQVDDVMNLMEGSVTQVDHAVISLVRQNTPIERVIYHELPVEEKPVISEELLLEIPEPMVGIELVAKAEETEPAPITEVIPLKKAVEPEVLKSDESAKAESVNNSETTLPALSGREAAIFSILQKEKFISRNDLAVAAWGTKNKKKATDDAIDQVISRLRRKFVQAGFPKSYITSKKGEGVMLIENE